MLCYFHFTDDDKEVNKNDNSYDSLESKESFWYSHCYIQNSEHLGVDLVIILFKEAKVSELKFANSATLMAKHDMEVFLGKDR
jgi:hypothetical protein